ncbi:MAG: class I SAM-dependent methyltransferase [Alphaproteobacteria bacterium]
MTDRHADENGWLSSSQAWLDRMPEKGDFAREFVLDKPMVERALLHKPANVLDVGCGDGRFCRALKKHGLATTGIDPVKPFVDFAASKDAEGCYKVGFADNLPFTDETFDLAVFYLTLIDIEQMEQAVEEAVRVLKPGGKILVANLSSFHTSNGTIGWVKGEDGNSYWPLGSYHKECCDWFAWDGIRIRNWHRPLSTYMAAFLNNGMTLSHFDEPLPVGCTQEQIDKYMKNPFLMMMEWRKLG